MLHDKSLSIPQECVVLHKLAIIKKFEIVDQRINTFWMTTEKLENVFLLLELVWLNDSSDSQEK